MSDQTIDTTRLKTVRKARKFTRAKLAKMAGMTERQLTKLEASNPTAVSDAPIERLAVALHIPPMALTGELPLNEADLGQITPPKSSCGCCP